MCSGTTASAREAREFKPVIEVDVTEVPDLQKWADEAKALCEEWYPRLTSEYRKDDDLPAKTVKIKFHKDKEGVADTVGNTINIAAKWVTAHPEDKGMVIHELMHVVQAYPRARNKAGWAVEAIADYVRYYQFEPEKPHHWRVNSRMTTPQAYGVGADFFVWIERTRDPEIVQQVHRALRKGKYSDALFQERTGRSLDDLWKEFVENGGKVPPAKEASKKTADK